MYPPWALIAIVFSNAVDDVCPLYSFPEVSFTNSTKMKSVEAVNRLWVDLLIFFSTQAVTVIDTVPSESGGETRSILLKALFQNDHVSVVIIGDVANGLPENVLRKQIFFIIYDTLEALQESVFGNDMFIFKDSLSSYFVITVTDPNKEHIDCTGHYRNSLRHATLDIFQHMWTVYRILETLIFFPSICGNPLFMRFDPVLQVTDSKHSGVSVLNVEDVYHNKKALIHSYKEFNGYPLQVRLFQRTPTSMKDLPESFLSTFLRKDIIRTEDWGGIDGFILGNLARFLNFTLKISAATDGQEYGWKESNGTFTGTIGDVIAQRADISFNGRFLKDYGSDEIEFTYPIYNDKFCVLVPKSLKIPTWMNIFQGLSTTVWELCLLTVLLSGIIWWLMTLLKRDDTKPPSYNKNCCWFTTEAFLMISSQPIALPKLGPERFFIASCLLFNIIVAGTFQGYLYTAFSTTSYYPDINTLEALDESGLPIATSSKLDDIFGIDKTLNSKLLSNLEKKIKTIKMAAIDEAATHRDVAAVERRNDAALYIQLKYLEPNGEPKLHIVEQCPRSYYLTYIVHRNYPFLPNIDKFLRKTWEGGFNKFWYDMTVYSVVLHQNANTPVASDTLKKLSIVDIQTAFLILVSGQAISLLVFLVEALHRILNNKGFPETELPLDGIAGKKQNQ